MSLISADVRDAMEAFAAANEKIAREIRAALAIDEANGDAPVLLTRLAAARVAMARGLHASAAIANLLDAAAREAGQ